MKIALEWMERIQSNKNKGAAKHVRHGKFCIIEIQYNGELLDCIEFQKSGVTEHSRTNCWLSAAKNKAQINTVVKYRILSDSEINSFTLI